MIFSCLNIEKMQEIVSKEIMMTSKLRLCMLSRREEVLLCPQDSLAAAKIVELGFCNYPFKLVSSKARPEAFNDAMSQNTPYLAPSGKLRSATTPRAIATSPVTERNK
jgi:hypothetical protein